MIRNLSLFLSFRFLLVFDFTIPWKTRIQGISRDSVKKLTQKKKKAKRNQQTVEKKERERECTKKGMFRRSTLTDLSANLKQFENNNNKKKKSFKLTA